MGEVATLSRLSDETVKRLLMIGKRHGLRPFLGHPKAMIALREEAAKRGIYATRGEELIVERAVFARMDAKGKGDEGDKPRAGTR